MRPSLPCAAAERGGSGGKLRGVSPGPGSAGEAGEPPVMRASGEGERGSSCRERGGQLGWGIWAGRGAVRRQARGERARGRGAQDREGLGPRPRPPARASRRRNAAHARGEEGGGPGHLVRGGAHLAALAGPEEVGHPPAARPAGPQDEGEEQQEPREPPRRPARAPHAAPPPRACGSLPARRLLPGAFSAPAERPAARCRRCCRRRVTERGCSPRPPTTCRRS